MENNNSEDKFYRVAIDKNRKERDNFKIELRKYIRNYITKNCEQLWITGKGIMACSDCYYDSICRMPIIVKKSEDHYFDYFTEKELHIEEFSVLKYIEIKPEELQYIFDNFDESGKSLYRDAINEFIKMISYIYSELGEKLFQEHAKGIARTRKGI